MTDETPSGLVMDWQNRWTFPHGFIQSFKDRDAAALKAIDLEKRAEQLRRPVSLGRWQPHEDAYLIYWMVTHPISLFHMRLDLGRSIPACRARLRRLGYTAFRVQAEGDLAPEWVWRLRGSTAATMYMGTDTPQ